MDLDNSYADESFEDIQSPVKKEQNVGDHDELFEDPSDDEDNGLGDLEEQDNGLGDEEEDNGLDDDEEEVKCNPEEQKFEEEGMNLDDFLKNFEGAEENDPKSKTIESDHPELRPLVGMSPPESGKKDARDIYLSKALHGSPAISGLMSAENLVHKNNKISPMANSSSENNINPLKSGGSGGKDLSSLTNRLKFVMEEEEKNAEKVNELLRQMKVNKKDEEAIVSAPKVKYPILSDSASDVANNYKKVKKLEKIAHTPPHHTGDDDENIANTRDINSLLAQVKQLKQDLKRRDERLSRITEHDALVTKKVETLTGEVSFGNMRMF